MSQETNAGEPASEGQQETVERLGKTLDEWRARIDELMVQLDLASHDVRDEVRKRVDTAENAYLAARSRLSDARRDASANASSLRQSIDKLLSDIKQAYEAAEAAIRRGRAD